MQEMTKADNVAYYRLLLVDYGGTHPIKSGIFQKVAQK
jgi:hypothetical protein